MPNLTYAEQRALKGFVPNFMESAGKGMGQTIADYGRENLLARVPERGKLYASKKTTGISPGVAALIGLGAAGAGVAGAEYIHRKNDVLTDEELGAYQNMMNYNKYASVAEMAKATAADFEKKASQSLNGEGRNMNLLNPQDIQNVANLAKTAAAQMGNTQETSLSAAEVQAVVDHVKTSSQKVAFNGSQALKELAEAAERKANTAYFHEGLKDSPSAMKKQILSIISGHPGAAVGTAAGVGAAGAAGAGVGAAMLAKTLLKKEPTAMERALKVMTNHPVASGLAGAGAVGAGIYGASKAASVMEDDMTKIAELQDTVDAALVASEALYKQATADAEYAVALFQEAQAVKTAMDNGAGQNPAMTTPTAQEDPLAQTFSLGALAEFMKSYQDARRAAGTPT
jgi:hypothetical protein